MLGHFNVTMGKPNIPNALTSPLDTGTDPNRGYADLHGDYFNPLGVLKRVIENQNIVKTTTFSLDSKNEAGGGLNNVPFITTFADTTRFRCDCWLETVLNSDNTTTQQLQYTQNIDIVFHKKFPGAKDPDSLITWPHIPVNTLTKDPVVDDRVELSQTTQRKSWIKIYAPAVNIAISAIVAIKLLS